MEVIMHSGQILRVLLSSDSSLSRQKSELKSIPELKSKTQAKAICQPARVFPSNLIPHLHGQDKLEVSDELKQKIRNRVESEDTFKEGGYIQGASLGSPYDVFYCGSPRLIGLTPSEPIDGGVYGKIKYVNFMHDNNNSWMVIKVISCSTAEDVSHEFTLARDRGIAEYTFEENGVNYILMPVILQQDLETFNRCAPIMRDSRMFSILIGMTYSIDSLQVPNDVVCHRDVKPGNFIFDSYRGRTNYVSFNGVTLVDFGSAKRGDFVSMFPAGTPITMAPELMSFSAGGDIPSLQVDLYALGMSQAMLVNVVSGDYYEVIPGVTDYLAYLINLHKKNQVFIPEDSKEFNEQTRIHFEPARRQLFALLQNMTKENPKERLIDITEVTNELMRISRLLPQEYPIKGVVLIEEVKDLMFELLEILQRDTIDEQGSKKAAKDLKLFQSKFNRWICALLMFDDIGFASASHASVTSAMLSQLYYFLTEAIVFLAEGIYPFEDCDSTRVHALAQLSSPCTGDSTLSDVINEMKLQDALRDERPVEHVLVTERRDIPKDIVSATPEQILEDAGVPSTQIFHKLGRQNVLSCRNVFAEFLYLNKIRRDQLYRSLIEPSEPVRSLALSH